MSNNNKTPLTISMSKRIKHCSILLLCTFFLFGCGTAGVKSQKASNFNADLGIRYLQTGRLQLANEKIAKTNLEVGAFFPFELPPHVVARPVVHFFKLGDVRRPRSAKGGKWHAKMSHKYVFRRNPDLPVFVDIS